jgi:hypothetical protein
VNAHPSERQLAAFRDGTMAAADVLALDAHLSGCAECRARAQSVAGARAAALARTLAVESDEDLHPHDEQLADFVDGRSASAGEVARHVSECAECAATVEDLRLLRVAIVGKRKTSTARWAVAAAAIAVVGVSSWMWNASRPGTVGVNPAAVAGLDHFSASERALILSALKTGALPPAPHLDGVRAHQGRLMGTPVVEHPSFAPLSPVATAIGGTQPEFRWSPLEGANGYVVTVVDDHLRPVAESPVVGDTRWRPATALPRGLTYSWQVRAMLAGGSRTAPSPPEPEAKFFVLGDAEAGEVESLRQRAEESPLAAIILAQHGLMEDAEAELAKAAEENPSDAALRKLANAAKQARMARTDRR